MKRKLLMVTAAVLIGASMAQAASVPPSGRLAFNVIRKGKDIGDYTIAFRASGKSLTVKLKTDVVVKVPILGIKLYVFKQASTEAWQNGKLTGLKSVTNDNGDKHNITLGKSDLIPASLWNNDMLKSHTVLNTIDGKAMSIKVGSLGQENVSTPGGNVVATHYRVSGDLKRDLWYDGSGVLVKVAFLGDDGTPVEYDLK